MHRTAHAWARRRCKECPLVFARASGAKPARRERNSQRLAPWNACLAPRALQRPRYQLTSALHVPWQRSKASRRLNPHRVVQWCCTSEALQASTKMKRAASLASNARLALLPYCWGPKQERVEAPLASFFSSRVREHPASYSHRSLTVSFPTWNKGTALTGGLGGVTLWRVLVGPHVRSSTTWEDSCILCARVACTNWVNAVT